MSRKKRETLKTKHDKLGKDEDRKSDKYHKGQIRFELVIEWIDDHFPPLLQKGKKIASFKDKCILTNLLHL